MQISQYMEKALFDSRDGFYQKENIYEHFCTPFSFNSSFKRFIAKYLISYNTSIFEVGPSSGGVLAEELLKLGFKKQLTLCEKSTLARKNLQSKFSSQSSVNISNDIPKLKDNTVVFLQEVLDCFSADWFKIEDKKLYSCYLDNDYQVLKKDIKQPYKCDYFQHIKTHSGAISHLQYLYSSEATLFFQSLLNYSSSYIVIIDYGFLTKELINANSLVKTPLRAYKKHDQVEKFWHLSGECDLTYDIDFGWHLQLAVDSGAQVDFFGTLSQFIATHITSSIEPEELSLLKPYLDPRQLGEIFKVAIIKTKSL